MFSRLLLVSAAFVWGSSFVAQRVVTDLIEPNFYNGIRFLLGAIALLPVLFFLKDTVPDKPTKLPFPVACLLLGTVLFSGAFLQQYGIQFTTAGKAGFLTAIYIVLVPLFGLFLGQRLSYAAAFGVVAATFGAGLLSLKDDFGIGPGDLSVLFGTIFWAAHILLLTDFTHRYPCLRLAFWQFVVCSFIALTVGYFTETISMSAVIAGWLPLVWGGVLSVAFGFTAQLVGQRAVPPTEASLILSLEMAFAGLTGYFILGEMLTAREIAGVLIMLVGTAAAQLPASPQHSFKPLFDKGDRS